MTPAARIRRARRIADIARRRASALGADPMRVRLAGHLSTMMHRAGFGWRVAIRGAATLVSR